MTPGATSISAFDPYAHEYLLDPVAATAPLLEDAPVFYHEPLNAYFVLRYDDVRRVLDDSETYSSRTMQSTPVRPELRARIPAEWEHAGRVVHEVQTANMDPPEHTWQRYALRQAFTPRRVERVKTDIEVLANELLDGLFERGSCDLVNEFATQLTLRIAVGKLMDVPDELLPGFYEWMIDVFKVLSPIDLKPEDVRTPDDELVGSYERLYRASVTYREYLDGRRSNPGDDIASAMLTLTDEDGRPSLSTDQVLGHMIGVTAAGTDTTAVLMVNMVRAFTVHPDQLQLVLDQPALWDNAVNEGMRRIAIGTQVFRVSTRDSEIAGVHIPAGSNVYASIASANGDPAKFPDPLRFDVRRENAREHLGFSHGRHHCLGSQLARPEVRIALCALYERLPELKADLDQELDVLPILGLRMITSQRVSWSPGAGTPTERDQLSGHES